MKKFLLVVLVFTLGVLWGAPVQAATNDFTISKYDVQMTLGRDGSNNSTLGVTETITAEFPDTDQNHGLERAFVKEYDGHSLSFNLTSVTDVNGTTLPYHWSGDNLRIGDADVYVHGSQTYVITYTMQNVTRYYSDTGSDEFYWDVIGTEWQVPIEQASLKLAMDSAIVPSRTEKVACYWGASSSSTPCELIRTDTGYSAEVSGLQAGDGMTIAVGFTKGTFAVYTPSIWERVVQIWSTVQIFASAAAVAVAAWLGNRWSKRLEREKELGTIVPEYLPPENASVATSAMIYGTTTTTKAMTAQLLDLAVRHYIRIYQVKEKSLFSAAEYEVEVIKDVTDLRWEEQEILKDMFDALPTVGQRLNLKKLKNNTAYYSRTLNNDGDLTKLVRGDYGLRELDPHTKAWLRKTAIVLLIVGVLLGSIVWIMITGVMAFVLSFMSWRLSDTGLALKRYLKGLKMYISVAEQERLAMLQSPEGAEKVASVGSGTDSAQMIKLYEKVLPYAVLFGQEKEWSKQLGRYYEAANTSPDWYAGNNAVFNAAMFSSAMNSFSTASMAASSYSSSSGGSGGGGFSGGGGGGGGGGGW